MPLISPLSDSGKTTLDHFNDGRQCVLQQVIEQIEITRDIDGLEKFCTSYLDTVLAHGRETLAVPACAG